MRRNEKTKVLYIVALLVVYAMGAAGYLLVKLPWYDALYYAAQLFFLNYYDVESGNLLLYVGRVLCPIMTAAGLAALVRNFYKLVLDYMMSKSKKATALYYDSAQMKKIGENFKRPVYMEKKPNKYAKSHVFLLTNDIDNLKLYDEMKHVLAEGSKVYIELEEMDSKLLAKSNVVFFNTNEIIARKYWRERNLIKFLVDGKLAVKIAIIGFGSLGKNILNYGLTNNIYSLNQSIEYHVWGNGNLHSNMLGGFDKMNGDTITYHGVDWKEDILQLKEFDRIIVTREPNIELLQALLYLNSDAEIDFYNPMDNKLGEIYEEKTLTPFGQLREILTEENIKTDKLYRDAKELNYNYAVVYDTDGSYTWDCPDVVDKIEKKWNELNNFKKGSNVAGADYQPIREMVAQALGMNRNNLSSEQLEVLKEMEHIRWCRYHFVNHWQYAKERNDQKKKHPLLVPYSELSKAEGDKDAEVIQLLFGVRVKENM